jgi:hypothetical protein
MSNQVAPLIVAGALLLTGAALAQSFDPLFRVVNIKGACQIKRPDAAAFEPALNGKAYPFGTTVRTMLDGEATVLFSNDDGVLLRADSVATVLAATNEESRIVRLANGRLLTAVREGLAERAVVIETPVAECDAIANHSDVAMTREKDGLTLTIATANGGLSVHGPQFTIPRLKAGCAVRIASTPDRGLTRITNTSGDYKIEMDHGADAPVPVDTTPNCTVRIWREHAPVTGKLVVSVLAVGADGKGRESFAYVIGEPSIAASGLPVAAESAPTGAVAAAVAPAANAATNAPAAKEQSLF